MTSGADALQDASPDVNRRWFVEYVTRADRGRGLAVLDYGCGAGDVVRLLRAAGTDCWGADPYYEGSADLQTPGVAELLDAGVIRMIPADGSIPFPDDSFDLIVSDQVLEHVEDLEGALRELDRVLKPSGHMYHHFPTREVLREGHIGIPLAHRLRPGAARSRYTRAMYRLGFGTHRDARPDAASWTEWKLAWLDQWCHYRSLPEMRRTLGSRFVVTHREIDYCRFRAGGTPLGRLLGVSALRAPAAWLFRRLGFACVELRRPTSAPPPP